MIVLAHSLEQKTYVVKWMSWVREKTMVVNITLDNGQEQLLKRGFRTLLCWQGRVSWVPFEGIWCNGLL